MRNAPYLLNYAYVYFSIGALGGERGIRTLESLRLTAFRERPVQPLLHLSNQYSSRYPICLAEKKKPREYTQSPFWDIRDAGR